MGFKRLREYRLRRPLGLAIASAAVLGVLTILWLAVSTRSAILSAQLSDLDDKWKLIEWENTELERNIGQLTSVQTMDQRMRVAGFGLPERAIYITVTVDLPATPAGLFVTATLTGTAPLMVPRTPADSGGAP